MGQECDEKGRVEGGEPVLLVENQGGKTTSPFLPYQDGRVLLSPLAMYAFHGFII